MGLGRAVAAHRLLDGLQGLQQQQWGKGGGKVRGGVEVGTAGVSGADAEWFGLDEVTAMEVSDAGCRGEEVGGAAEVGVAVAKV